MSATLKIGIASYQEMKARTMRVARGEERLALDALKVWFSSIESFAGVLSADNRELLRVIAGQAPASLDELTRLAMRRKPNLSRALKTVAGYCLIRLDRGARGRLLAGVIYDLVAGVRRNR